jgi:hypothetical protein
MPIKESVTKRILDVIAQQPECLLDELILACPELTWNQVFLAVDALSRSGDIRLKARRPGVYVISAVRKSTEAA